MVEVNISDELAAVIAQEEPGRRIEEIANELLVFWLYSRGKVSSGKGAGLLGMERVDFIKRAGSLSIPYFQITPVELDEEVRGLQAQRTMEQWL